MSETGNLHRSEYDIARDAMWSAWRAYTSARAEFERIEREGSREFAKLFNAIPPAQMGEGRNAD